MKLRALCNLSHQGTQLAPGDTFDEPSEYSARKLVERGCAAPAASPKKATKKKAKAAEE